MIIKPKPAVAADKVMNIRCGMPGTMPRMIKMAADIKSAVGFANWVEACSVIDSVVVTRVTTMAVASDNNNDGICATKPSPMVSKV